MTPEEIEKEKAWARWAAERDDGACVSAGGLYVALQKFPPPDVRGLSPEDEVAAIKKWVDEIVAWQRETAANPAELIPRPRTDTNSTQAPVA